MSTLDISRNYATGQILLEADLDAIQDGLETFFNTTKINDDNIQTNSLDGSTKIIDNTVTTAILTDETMETAKFADSSVTTAKILDGGLLTADIAASAVTTAKIAATAITTDKFAALAVTSPKLLDITQLSSSSGVVYTATTSGPGADVSCGTSVTITTYGRPLLLMLNGASVTATAGSGSTLTYNAVHKTTTAPTAPPDTTKIYYVSLYKAGSLLFTQRFAATVDPILNRSGATYTITTDTGSAPGSICFIDDPGVAASVTYDLRVNYANSNDATYFQSPVILFQSIKLIAVEL